MSHVEMPEQTDVVVIGGGIMGTSAAYFLAAESNVDVLLVERDAIASGSTGDSSAILRHHYGSNEIYSRMAWLSHQFYREFDDRIDQAIAYAKSPMVQFATAENRERVQAGFDVLEQLDIPVSRYEAENLGSMYPQIETGQFEFAVSDDDSAYSDGTDAAGGFSRAAQQSGCDIVTGVTARRLRTENGAVVAVETDSGTVSCDSVVIAAGPWTGQFVDHLDVDIPLEITREQVLILDPPAGFDAESVPTSGSDEGWYIRPDFGGGILLATHHTDESADPDQYSDVPDQETMLELLDGLEGFIPELADATVMGRYCGIYTSTPDHDFVIDEVGPDGCFVACGFSGHGFKHAPIVGQILRDMVTTGDTELVDIDYFSLDRFDDDPNGHADDQRLFSEG